MLFFLMNLLDVVCLVMNCVDHNIKVGQAYDSTLIGQVGPRKVQMKLTQIPYLCETNCETRVRTFLDSEGYIKLLCPT